MPAVGRPWPSDDNDDINDDSHDGCDGEQEEETKMTTQIWTEAALIPDDGDIQYVHEIYLENLQISRRKLYGGGEQDDGDGDGDYDESCIDADAWR